MSNDKYYDALLPYINEHGETGVNVLAKQLDVPLSTLQRYLERQTYFRKTINRKWDIPNNVDADIKSNTMTLMVNSVENALMLLDSQLSEIQSNVQNALMPVGTLKRAVIGLSAPVADKSDEMHPFIVEMDKGIKESYMVFKKYMSKIPEEYQELIKNVDLYRLSVDMGTKFMESDFNVDISSLLLEKTTELSEDTVEILKEYQKR